MHKNAYFGGTKVALKKLSAFDPLRDISEP